MTCKYFGCKELKEVYSYIEETFDITDPYMFTVYDLDKGDFYWPDRTLYVPVGAKAKYETAKGWIFKNIVEMAEQDPITLIAKDVTIEYGEEISELEYVSEGGILSGAPTLSCEVPDIPEVGSYPIVITKGSVENENVTYVNGVLTITKASLTVSVGNYTITEGDELPEFKLTYEGFKNGETEDVLITKPTVTCGVAKDYKPGVYEITVSGAEAKNYEVSYVAGKLVVEKNANFVEHGEIAYEVKEDGGLTVRGTVNGEDTQIDIPAEIEIEGKKYVINIIAADAFRDNTKLKDVTIPETVEQIGSGAFAGCTNLRDIYVYAPQPISMVMVAARGMKHRAEGTVVAAFDGVDKETCVVHVPYGCKAAYGQAEGWREFAHIVEMDAPTGLAGVAADSVYDVYDLSGRKVRSQATTLQGLPKGVYFVNGRKVVAE